MLELLSVGVGGGLGSCLRYGLTLWSRRWSALPFGTLLSNVIAGLLIGFFIGMDREVMPLPPNIRLFLTTGLLGGLSTFSTFSLETVALFQAEKHLLGTGNILLNLCLSLGGVLLGMALARLWAKLPVL